MFDSQDLTGQYFGRLRVIKQADDYISPNGNKNKMWLCKCDCGNQVTIREYSLTHGHTQSCGCYRLERLKQAKKRYNRYEIFDNYVIMYTLKNEPFYIDLEDFERVKDICWHKGHKGYFMGEVNGQTIRLHRFIMNCPDDKIVDHIGGSETLWDNRKANLRIATVAQNNYNRKKRSNNTSGTIGVNWDKNSHKWYSSIRYCNKNISLGYFENIEDAIKARREAEEKYFGEFSYNNSQLIAQHNNINQSTD